MTTKSQADSSTKSTQTTESRQQEATGVTGTVVQGQTIDITGLGGSDIEKIFKAIGESVIQPTLNAAGEGLTAIRQSASESIASSKALARPDLAGVEGTNKTIAYIVAGIVIIGGLYIWRKRG